MTAAAFTPDDASAETAHARRRGLLDRQLERLDQLIAAGMDMVEGLAAQAAGGPRVVEGDVVLAYSRASRAVRMAILLQSRLVAEPEAKAEAQTPAPGEDAPGAIGLRWLEPEEMFEEWTSARRERVEQIVEGVARRERGDDDAAERLGREAVERLERDDIYGAVLTRPISELVADICRHLGLTPDWPRLSRQPWAQRERAGGAVGGPLKDYAAGPAPPAGAARLAAGAFGPDTG